MAELAVITGGANGIGKSFAINLAARGARLVLIDIKRKKLEALADELSAQYGIEVEAVVADLSKVKDQVRVADRLSALKNVDLLINSAGYGAPVEFHGLDADAHIDMLNVHVASMIRCCRAVLPQMRECKKGAIINISGQAAYLYSAGNAMYGSTKCFVEAFTRNLEAEYAPVGIKLQLLVPAYIRTSFHDTEFYKLAAVSKIPSFYWMNVDTVTTTSLRQLGTGKLICVPGLWHKITYHILRRRLVPRFILKRSI